MKKNPDTLSNTLIMGLAFLQYFIGKPQGNLSLTHEK